MTLRVARLTAVGILLITSDAHPQQRDCGSPGASDDPLCLAMTDLTRQPARVGIPAPGVPVIRDGGVPRSAGETGPRAELPKRPEAVAGTARRPAELTEFQRFVEQATGQLFPIFGASLFEDVPSTFAPADRVPVTPDYPLGPGDQLVIRGWGQIDLNVSPVVDQGGAIYIAQIGEVNVAGLKFAQVHDYLKHAIGRVYRNFDLSVGMGQLRSTQVLVVGHARRPGAYTVSSLSTLVNAIFSSGGPAPGGSMREIRLRRGGQTITEFDLYDLLVNGDKSKDQPLLSGDVIYIPPVGPQVALTGSLNTPAIYELNAGGTLEDALQLAGGLTPLAAAENILIERTNGAGRRVLRVSLGSEGAGRSRLENGDIVSVLAIVPRFENAVTLRGNVADPVRMPWRPGMKIRDLIPDASVLVARDYWLARNRLVPPERRETTTAPERQNPGTDSQSPVMLASVRAPDRLPEVPPPTYSLAAPAAIAASREALPLTKNSPERSPLEVNWSYAVIERLDPKDLKTTLVPFRLGKAVLDRDEVENLPLEPGDVVTIFSASDLREPQRLQTRYVRLEGEFESAGVYSVLPGETLGQLVRRAGGLTPQAYLFGSEFLRESSRLEQQQRLDDLAESVEREAATTLANISGSVVSPEQATATGQQVQGQRELVVKLRRIRATGRIVLGLDPNASGIERLPDLPLEDGDVFMVPSRPSVVNVLGSVYSGTSFLYEHGRQTRDYLRKAGGPTRGADRGSMFLIRADGSVVSKSWKSGLTGGGFDSIRLNPGDTIVVPDQINKTTFLRSLKDWSQVFAQFGLGAAAINILR